MSSDWKFLQRLSKVVDDANRGSWASATLVPDIEATLKHITSLEALMVAAGEFADTCASKGFQGEGYDYNPIKLDVLRAALVKAGEKARKS
jgi:hypothetical protein